MQKFATTAIAATLITSAMAADARADDWSGLYGGAFIGGASLSSKWSGKDSFSIDGGEGGPTTNTTPVTPDDHPGGFVAGIDAGYNFQFDAVVLGVEGDESLVNGKAVRSIPGADTTLSNSANTDFTSSKISNLQTVRGRVGLDLGDALVYATGGGAFADVKNNWLSSGGAGASFGSKSGWTAGAGVETYLFPSISLSFECLYLDLGSSSASPISGSSSSVIKADATGVTARVGFNFHL